MTDDTGGTEAAVLDPDAAAVTGAPDADADAAVTGAPDAAHSHDGTDGHEHPSDRAYVKIAVILGILTAIEVFTYFESVHRMSDAALYVLLTVLMVLKFVYVVAWFMHLKFDSILFRRIFYAGVVLAVGVYLIMLTAFRIWGA